MGNKIRWGLLGAGGIANAWMQGARQFDDMEVVAVSSRTHETASKMAATYQISQVMTYEEMAACPDIDAVYIPVLNKFHYELAKLALENKKAVLVEKPATVTTAEFRSLMEIATQNNTFLMEGFWTRFFPFYKDLKAMLADGIIGEIRAIDVSFCFRIGDDRKDHSRLRADVAGGAVLDVGVYCLNFADLIMERPAVKMHTLVSTDTDDLHLQVDEQVTTIAMYDKGEIVTMHSAVRTDRPALAIIYGTNGRIEIPEFFRPSRAIIYMRNETNEFSRPVPQAAAGYQDSGFQFEIKHVNECLRKGLIESPELPWAKTLEILQICEDIRKEAGLSY